MVLIRRTRKLGNSAGVLLPKKLLGSEVKITVVNRPINLKKEAMKLAEPYLREILGIFILNKAPIELLAISSNIREIIEKDSIKLSIVPLSVIKKDIRTKAALRDKLLKAETILNHQILAELKKEIKEISKLSEF